MTAGTTVKLPAALKKRIAPLARAAGKTPHAWMVEALGEQVERAERRQAFVAEAIVSQLEVAEGGPVYEASEVFDYVRARVAGRKVKRPAPRKG